MQTSDTILDSRAVGISSEMLIQSSYSVLSGAVLYNVIL